MISSHFFQRLLGVPPHFLERVCRFAMSLVFLSVPGKCHSVPVRALVCQAKPLVFHLEVCIASFKVDGIGSSDGYLGSNR